MISLNDHRAIIRNHYLADEATLTKQLLSAADMGDAARASAQKAAAEFITSARKNAKRSGLIDKFLQEYGLSTAEGVTLMRLAEALLRTPDVATADALIRDKVEAGDWSVHKGASPFPLVNFSTNALMLTAAWLDDVDAAKSNPATRMLKATKSLLDRIGEPVIRASVAQAMKIMGEHFVLGETIDEAMKKGRSFSGNGYLFSFDMLGEAAHTAEDAEKYFQDYAEAITAIARHSKKSESTLNPGISVKLSALHPRYEYGKKERVLTELGIKLRTLALAAKNANMGFNIDAEEADRLDISLDLIEMVMRDSAFDGWQGFGVVVQAYQRRAGFVLDWLATLTRETGRRIMVRLVKGAYWDSEIKRAQVMGLETYPVFTRKVLTDLSYLACACKLFDNTDVFYPQFATHNALTATSVREIAKSHPNGPYTDYELQRLHGMGELLHDTLIEDGMRSRIYAPVGGHKELLPYLVRRLLENGANSSFVNQLIDPDLSVEEIIASPVLEVRELDVIPNSAIRAPRDLFTEENIRPPRLSAKGVDLTDPAIARQYSQAMRAEFGMIQAKPLTTKPDKGQILDVSNPANKEDKIGSVQYTTDKQLNHAIISAKKNQPRWATLSAETRSSFLMKAANTLEARMTEFMAMTVFEAGKTWEDAIAEVREAVDFCRYYAGQAKIISSNEPLGIITCISPWNFPLAIFLGQVTAALAVGNAVIAKPAEQTPLIAFEAVKLLIKAGVPQEVLHYLPGTGENVGAKLVAHPDIAGVIFTGSTPVAQIINRTLIETGKNDAVLIAETGGINAMIIDSTALLEQAVNDVVASAFQSAGQRCSACRLVCVQADIADKFRKMLAGAMAELTIGDPSDLATDVGPVIDSQAQSIITAHLARLENNAHLIARSPTPTISKGTFFGPIAFELDNISDLTKEVFGPALHVVRYEAEQLDQVIDDINTLGFGLTLGIHTRIDETMHTIAARARVGNIYVNRNQIGAVVGVQPFGGERQSGTGPKAGGPHYLPALTKNPVDPGRIKTGANSFSFPVRPMSEIEREAVAKADTAFKHWIAHPDQTEFWRNLKNTATKSLKPIIERIINNRHQLFDPVNTLPGPTGESNTLRLKGRGTIICLGDPADNTDNSKTVAKSIAIEQMILALAAGNSTIVPNCPLSEQMAALLAKESENFALVSILDRRSFSETLFIDSRICAVACEQPVQRKYVQQILARREGAIIPALRISDSVRFAVERTLSINTTAAGGDVRLLSLEA